MVVPDFGTTEDTSVNCPVEGCYFHENTHELPNGYVLLEHLSTLHRERGENGYFLCSYRDQGCDTSPKKQWDAIRVHTIRHLGLKPYICSQELVADPCLQRFGDPAVFSRHLRDDHTDSRKATKEAKKAKTKAQSHMSFSTPPIPAYYPLQWILPLSAAQFSSPIPVPPFPAFNVPAMDASRYETLHNPTLMPMPAVPTTIISAEGTSNSCIVPIHAPMSGSPTPFVNAPVQEAPAHQMLHGPATASNAYLLSAGPPAQGFLPSIVAGILTPMLAAPPSIPNVAVQPVAPSHTLGDQPNASLMPAHVAHAPSASFSPIAPPASHLYAPNTPVPQASPRSAPLSPVPVQVITLLHTNLIREDASPLGGSSGTPTGVSHTPDGTAQETSPFSTPQNSAVRGFPVSDLRATAHETSPVAKSLVPPQIPRSPNAPVRTDAAIDQMPSHGEPIRREKSTRQARAAPYPARDEAHPAGRKASTGLRREDSNLAGLWFKEFAHDFVGASSSSVAHEAHADCWHAESPAGELLPYAEPPLRGDPFMPSFIELPSRRNSALTQHGSQTLLESPSGDIFREPTPPLEYSAADNWVHTF